jgi:hypothetical protein
VAWLRKLSRVSSIKAGCLVTLVGVLAIGGWAARAGMPDPGFPMASSAPFFMVAGVSAMLVLRGLIALYDRFRGGD